MNDSEFRKDIISGEWVLIAGGLKKKPNFFAGKKILAAPKDKKNCPFEDLSQEGVKLSSGFVNVIPNKFPILTPHKICPVPLRDMPYECMRGVGFQEVVITRDHNRSIGFMTQEEISLVLEAYLSRYRALKKEKCIEYILIFHNNGPTAGASVDHPHSQILALPIIPLDVSRSLAGSGEFFKKNKKCAHCELLKKELRENKRVIFKNKNFICISPFAAHVSFEMRIYPLSHNSNFENISDSEREDLAQIMQVTFAKLKNAMNNPDYNFFIHTAPAKVKNVRHYHWHLEILPRTNIWGGLELGSGTEVIKISPEEASKIFRNAKSV